MPTDEMMKGEKNRKTTAETDEGHEKAKGARNPTLEKHEETGATGSNHDEPRNQKIDPNDNKKSGSESPKKKDEEQKSKN